jgi:hypothetical protein
MMLLQTINQQSRIAHFFSELPPEEWLQFGGTILGVILSIPGALYSVAQEVTLSGNSSIHGKHEPPSATEGHESSRRVTSFSPTGFRLSLGRNPCFINHFAQNI